MISVEASGTARNQSKTTGQQRSSLGSFWTNSDCLGFRDPEKSSTKAYRMPGKLDVASNYPQGRRGWMCRGYEAGAPRLANDLHGDVDGADRPGEQRQYK